MIYEKLLELSIEFNEMLLNLFRLFPFLFCCLLTIAILAGGIITFVEYMNEKIKRVNDEHK